MITLIYCHSLASHIVNLNKFPTKGMNRILNNCQKMRRQHQPNAHRKTNNYVINILFKLNYLPSKLCIEDFSVPQMIIIIISLIIVL